MFPGMIKRLATPPSFGHDVSSQSSSSRVRSLEDLKALKARLDKSGKKSGQTEARKESGPQQISGPGSIRLGQFLAARVGAGLRSIMVVSVPEAKLRDRDEAISILAWCRRAFQSDVVLMAPRVGGRPRLYGSQSLVDELADVALGQLAWRSYAVTH